MYSLTILKNAYDNRTHRRMDFETWEGFVGMLESLSTQPIATKQDAVLISPAVYTEGTTRANKNVEQWGHWACVDIDDYKGTLDDIRDRFASNNCVIYSTASSKPEQIKLRVVFDLDRRVESDEIKAFWFALNKSIGDLNDEQTKDASRMYYIPATYDNAYNFFYVQSGSPLSVGKLKLLHPYVEKTVNSFLDRLSPEMREQVLSHRKNSMTNCNVTWSGYRDCPYFPNKMADEYKTVSETGWYSQMYRIMIATACNAVKNKYPITQDQIANMCRELDAETGNWYDNRPLSREAGGAIEWAYANTYEDLG